MRRATVSGSTAADTAHAASSVASDDPSAGTGPAGDAATRFERDGFCHLPALLEPVVVTHLNEALEEAFGTALPDGPYGILRHNLRRLVPAFAEVLADGRIAARMAELLGLSSIRLFQDPLVWKPPGTCADIAWHQDYAYLPLAEPLGVTLWVALDDADQGNGCLRYVPGSQHAGECAPTVFAAGTGTPPASDLPAIDLRGREAEVVSLPVRAGDGIAHHPLVWHGSPGNSSTRQRRAWSMNWISADARWQPGHAPHPFNYQLAPVAGSMVEGELFPLFVFGAPSVPD